MRVFSLVLTATSILILSGCCPLKPATSEVAMAIDLCGSIGKLQAANTHYLADVNSLAVKGTSEQSVTYPELTPQLRVSAMRSTSHCINLQLNKITSEQYDKLMAAEAAVPAMAERALTPEQLESLIAKGYKTVATILRQANVSEAAIATVADGKSVPQPDIPPDGGELAESLKKIRGSVSEMSTRLTTLPTDVVKALGERPSPPSSRKVEVVTVLFESGIATLDAEALQHLGNAAKTIAPQQQLSIVGSADAVGDELKNMELSRQRAQSVATWLLVNRGVEPRNINVAANGAKKGRGAAPQDRSVTVYRYLPTSISDESGRTTSKSMLGERLQTE